MGRGYKGGASHYRSLSENTGSLKTTYEFHNGYFGHKGKGRSYTRNITSDNPEDTAREFYNKAAYGGLEKRMKNGNGVYTKMSDGTILSYRNISASDGSPTVEINIRTSTYNGDIKYQKIHFVKGR